MLNEFLALFNLIGAGFALALGFRGLDELLWLVDSFLQRRKDRKDS